MSESVCATRSSESTFRKGDCSSSTANALLESIVEDCVPGSVVKIGEHDGVFLGQALALLMRAIVKSARDEGGRQNCDRDVAELRSARTGKTARPYTARARYRRSSALAVALEALQIGADVGGVLITQIAILLQSLVDDLFQLRWDFPDSTPPAALGRDSGSLRRSSLRSRRGTAVVPVAISYSTAPNENRSVRLSSSLRPRLLRRHVGHRPQRCSPAGQRFQRQHRLFFAASAR